MKKIVIYGAGAFGKSFYKALDGNVDFFIDDYSQEKYLYDLPIKKISQVDKDTPIYISVLQHSKKIQGSLRASGFTDVIGFTHAVRLMPNILEIISQNNYLWLVHDRDKMLNEKKLLAVKKLLKDEKSKSLLDQIIKLRSSLHIDNYIAPEGEEYFPSDVPILQNLTDINFIDCGAYIGDTIEALMQKTNSVKSTLSFEPDKENIHALQNELQKQKKEFPKTDFFLYPAGVYSKNSILKFANKGIASSANLDTNAVDEVSVVSLDSTILYASPNYIKMDIEGAEYEALLGAKETLQKHKPNLAICLYHKPQDLWELPLLIQEIEPSYDMYIRVHEDMCLSTVLYCISRSSDV